VLRVWSACTKPETWAGRVYVLRVSYQARNMSRSCICVTGWPGRVYVLRVELVVYMCYGLSWSCICVTGWPGGVYVLRVKLVVYMCYGLSWSCICFTGIDFASVSIIFILFFFNGLDSVVFLFTILMHDCTL
jgi:hypothetical protein